MAADQSYFDFLVPVTKELLRVDEVMTILRMEKDSVYSLVDSGDLEAHQGDGRRSHYRITRRSVVTRLAQTAKYQPDDIVTTLTAVGRRLLPQQRQTLIRNLQTS